MSESIFVPHGGNRRETAKALIETAEQNGIDPRTVKRVNGGYEVTEALADILAADMGDPDEADKTEPEGTTKTEDKSSTKTSGNRAAKKNS